MAKSRISSKGIYGLSFLIILFIGIVFFNIIAHFTSFQFDATADKRYSLSEGTIKYLDNDKNFPNRIFFQIYLDGNLPAEIKRFQAALISKLKEFKKYAGNRLEYEFLDPNIGTKDERTGLYQQLFAQGKGILPMNLSYQKDGQTNKLLLWPGALINYNGAVVDVMQLLPGTMANQQYTLDQNLENQVQNSINSLEYMLVSAIKRTTQTNKPRIAFIQGHGELNFAETQRVRTVIAPYYSLEDVTLNENVNSLKEYDGVVIARPKIPYSEKDKYIVDQFVMNGGRLMVFMDQLNVDNDTLQMRGITHTTRQLIGLDKLLFDYGIKINDNLAMDATCAPIAAPGLNQAAIPWYYYIRSTPSTHPITRNLDPVVLRYANTIEFVGNNKNLESPILTTSTNATASNTAPLLSLGLPQQLGPAPKFADNPEEEKNKIMLAGLIEGRFESHYKNRIVSEYTNNKLSNFKAKSVKDGKILVIGNGNFIESLFDSIKNPQPNQPVTRPNQFNNLKFDATLAMANSKQQLYYGNQEFFQNMVDYMLGDNSSIDIRSKQIDIHPIDKDKIINDSSFWKLINMVLPSTLVLISAFVFYRIRKRKYTSINSSK